MSGTCDIRFRDGARTYRFDPGTLTLRVGDKVITDTAQGRELGIVASAKRPVTPQEQHISFRHVIRIATPEDLATYEENLREEQEAFRVCRDMIDQHQLEMNLVAAEYTIEDRKLLFYFTADGRVDFRDLVRDLASYFRLRIELRQIGVRDDAKKNGGMGICGRELCCSSWMNAFVPVSIRMAKDQNISMNPTKVSGMCGRLLCCLNYEHEAYRTNRKLLPKQGAMINTPDGMAKVVGMDIPGLKVTLLPELPDGSWGQQYTVAAETIGFGEKRRAILIEQERETSGDNLLVEDDSVVGQTARAPRDGAGKEGTGAAGTAGAEGAHAGCPGNANCPKKKPEIDREETLLVSSADYSATSADAAGAVSDAAGAGAAVVDQSAVDQSAEGKEQVRPDGSGSGNKPRRAASGRGGRGGRSRGRSQNVQGQAGAEPRKPRYIIEPNPQAEDADRQGDRE